MLCCMTVVHSGMQFLNIDGLDLGSVLVFLFSLGLLFCVSFDHFCAYCFCILFHFFSTGKNVSKMTHLVSRWM